MQRNLHGNHQWGVILAGGDGVRLRSLTRVVSGDERPKQFSPLVGGTTLLTHTRIRAAHNIDRGRTLFVVTKTHERFYAKELEDVPPARMVVQPGNRGTLPAILWSLLRVLRQDSDASVALFPSDHYYSEEHKFMDGVASAFDLARTHPDLVILLGAEAKRPEVEYGWIEPDSAITSESGMPLMRVKRFWEKPSFEVAQELLQRGCLWNTFVMVGSALALVKLIQTAAPAVFGALEPLLSISDLNREAEVMDRVYARIPATDFSKHVLSGNTERLSVANLGDIGWSDLGDPRRLITTLFESGIDNPWVESGSCNQCGVVLGKSA